MAVWLVFCEAVEGSTLSVAACVTLSVWMCVQLCQWLNLQLEKQQPGAEHRHELPCTGLRPRDEDRVLGLRCWRWLLLPTPLNKAFLLKGKLGELS